MVIKKHIFCIFKDLFKPRGVTRRVGQTDTLINFLIKSQTVTAFVCINADNRDGIFLPKKTTRSSKKHSKIYLKASDPARIREGYSLMGQSMVSLQLRCADSFN